MQLKVELVDKMGHEKDVTNSNNIQYHNFTPWNLTVTKTGLVIANPEVSEYSSRTGNVEIGHVVIFYIDNKSQKYIGYNGVLFRIIK